MHLTVSEYIHIDSIGDSIKCKDQLNQIYSWLEKKYKSNKIKGGQVTPAVTRVSRVTNIL